MKTSKMILPCYILCVSSLFVLITAQPPDRGNKASSIKIAVAERVPNLVLDYPEKNASGPSTTEKTLIRVTRFNEKKPKENIAGRPRRQIIEAIQTAGIVISAVKAVKNTKSGEEILGMAKTVAIVVIVVASLCLLCCLVTTVLICVKCCCSGSDRKRNQAPTTIQVPQPIFVHTGPSGYQPQYHQQQAPQTWSPVMYQSPESRPMLPEPSAPPHSHDQFHVEHPPPSYEKIYKGR